MSSIPDEVLERARHIQLLLSDCDGVLTDGSLHYSATLEPVIEAVKVFHIHDGQGMRLARLAGLKLGIISGRESAALAARAREMSVDYLYQGVADKLTVYEEIKKAEGLSDIQIAYIGDDLPDLATMKSAGLSVAVADAVPDIKACAHLTTKARGGRGAVRETIELILKSQDKWEDLISRFDLC
ncbi:MAG: KdsC family phosphatase [Blastocatellales bacterium]